MTAEEIKAALRRRFNQNHVGASNMPTPWTCIEEFMGIDLWCLAGWTKPAPAARKAQTFPRIAIEVKISRSDLRSELLKPSKRAQAMKYSDQFYIATPLDLLTEDEKKWEQPDYEPQDFVRIPCPNNCVKLSRRTMYPGAGRKGQVWVPSDPGKPYGSGKYEDCDTCGGKTYVSKSKVEEEAPTVWIPPDVGLIEVDGRGCKFTKNAPVNESRLELSPRDVNLLARWISIRPDPYHARLRELKGLTYREERAKVSPEQLGGATVSTP